MSYYHAAPPSPTSSSSSFSSGPPQTPTSPDPPRRHSGGDYHSSLVIPSLLNYSDTYAYADKPKQNTADRRASHNAVERARRETLNARFLDLAALLPNLKHLRRPSKSAIVNSSIAHARAARRYRALAAAQLRALNAECDMVRREVNQWRARAGVHPAPTPVRSEGFAQVLSGEEPAFDPADLDAEDDAEEEWAPRAQRRRAPAEPACEGPLLLSDPYACASGEQQRVEQQQQNLHDTTTPPHHGHGHTAPPVAASYEAPNPYACDGFLLHEQGDAWAFASAQDGQGQGQVFAGQDQGW
ncbi:hypothetical protein DFH09DRAFT_268504 [Mycena vulgaris]|nr:hypothetical protein DFH09DRAFT_268504 [Mycena vulgaris]